MTLFSDFSANRVRRTGLMLFGLLLALMLATACHVTPYRRSLPEWVRRVNVPMVVNETYEPGLEEIVTTALVEEIMADGRLTVVPRRQADAVVKVTLKDFQEETASFSDDDIESIRRESVTVKVELFEPDDLDNPFATVPEFIQFNTSDANYRSIHTVMAPDARQIFADNIARRIFSGMMNLSKPVNP